MVVSKAERIRLCVVAMTSSSSRHGTTTDRRDRLRASTGEVDMKLTASWKRPNPTAAGQAPVKLGGRFSLNARGPSLASAEANTARP